MSEVVTFVLTLTLLFMVLPEAEGLTCYECASADDGTSSSANNYCYYPMDYDNVDTCTGSRCSHFYVDTDSEMVTVRGCAANNVTESTGCSDFTDPIYGIDGVRCLCESDYCNTAPVGAPFSRSILYAGVVIALECIRRM